MIDDLHRIGWKAFQDLCLAIAAEVLKCPIQSFPASNDGGRDNQKAGNFEPEKFEVHYETALIDLINQKRSGKIVRPKERPKGENVVT